MKASPFASVASACRFARLPLLVLAGLGAASGLVAAEPLRLYLANDDHTDYMWTADAQAYARVFPEMLDFHLKLTDETLGNAAPYQNRFNADGSFWLWEYERQRTPEQFAHLIERIKSGHISAPLNAVVSCYGGQPTEAVLRGMYYSGRLERRFGLRFTLAAAMENQSLPLGLASLWSGAGAQYSWRGVCGCASKLKNPSLARREHEIYWYTGLDGSRVLLKWHSFAPPGSKRSGGYAEAFNPLQAIKFLESDANFLSRYRNPGEAEPYAIRAAFGFGWDALDRKTGEPYAPDPKAFPQVDHFHLIAQAQTTPARQVIVSNQEDFFREFETRYGGALPSESLTHGNEWDLYSASMSETSAQVRRSVEKLRTAEALATLVSLQQPAALPERNAERDAAFMDLGLYWEHDWTADGPVPRGARAAWQQQLADAIGRYVDSLQETAAGKLATLIPAAGGSPRFFAFNALGWTRTDAADFPYDGPEDIHVRDLAAQADTPHQLVTVAGVKYLRILARDLPAVGYKVFEVQPGRGEATRDAAATFTDHTFENPRVKLVLDGDGAIRSLVDKRDPTVELAATIQGLKVNDFVPHDADGHSLVVENSGPVSVTVRVASDAERNHVTRITLYRDSDRIDLHNEILENFGDVRHWAFSFNLEAPDVHTEELGALLRVKKQAEGGDYANRNARYDYATLNHFADITNGANTRGLTLSNWDCAFVRLGQSTPDSLDTATAQLNVLAGGQVDGAQLGIRNQNGAKYFLQRFALRPHRGYEPAAALRFALEHQNPPVTGAVRGGAGAPLPATVYSLLTVSDPQVLLWALKPADEGIGHGVVARLWNASSAPVRATLAFTPGLQAAQRTTHLETDLAAAPLAGTGLALDFARQQLLTYRLLPKSAP